MLTEKRFSCLIFSARGNEPSAHLNKMKVQVFYNLLKKRLSVRSAETGLVINHADIVALDNAKFHVQPAGRAKVRREKRKNVHAYDSWQLCRPAGDLEGYSLDRAYYNPYKNEFFVNDKGEELRGKYEKVIVTGKQIFYKWDLHAPLRGGDF